MKFILKFCITFSLLFILSSTECMAANPLSPYGVSGWRCRFSTCGNYLIDDGPGYTVCSAHNLNTWGYMCPVCGTKYDICDKGCYYFLR